MKMSLDGFKKVSKDGNTTVLRHPDGHEMAINHSILSPKMRGEIEALPQHESEEKPKQNFDDGGEVKEVEDSYNKFAGTMKPAPKPLTREEKYAEIRKRNSSNAVGKTSTLDQPVYAEGGDVVEDLTVKDPESGQVEKYKEKIAPGPTVRGDNLEASLPDEEAAALKAADESLPGKLEAEMPSESKPEEQPQQAPPPQYDHAKAMLESHNAMTNAHNAAMQAYVAAQQKQQAPQQGAPQPQQGQQSDQQAQPQEQPQQAGKPEVQQPQTYEGLAGEAHSAIQDMQNYVAKQKTKNDMLMQSVMENKIDPNRLYSNASTGSKITTAIGLILGGMGAAATGGKNLAVDAMNKVIERDVDAQKANQANQINAYKLNLEATHNEEEARNLTINQLLSAAQGQLNKAGMQNQSATARANVLKTNAEIEQLKIQNDQKQYLFKSLQGSGEGGHGGGGSESAFQNRLNTIRMLNPDLGKDMEAKYLPGVGVASVPLPEKQRDKIIASKTLSKKLAELENFSRENSGTLLDPQIKAKGHALANDVISSYRIATDQGVFKPSDQAFLEKSLPMDPTAFFAKYRTIPAYREVRRLTDETSNQIQKSYGVKPFASDQQQSIPDGTQAKTKDGTPVIRRNGQWIKQ